jgi:6,7-dimethyl-8-ribityllumazine synthase
MKTIEGKLNAANLNFVIVVSRFNEFVSKKLLEGAVDCFKRHGAKEENLEVVWVPGAFEIPQVIKKIPSGRRAAIICLGAVIRGATPHFDFLSAEVIKGVASAALESKIPVINGILTTDTIEQAVERAGTKMGNKGWDAALAAIEMANLIRELGE